MDSWSPVYDPGVPSYPGSVSHPFRTVRYMSSKDFKQFKKDLRAAGAEFSIRNSGKGLITLPNGQKYFCPATPSDHRALKNIRADLKRLFGFEF